MGERGEKKIQGSVPMEWGQLAILLFEKLGDTVRMWKKRHFLSLGLCWRMVVWGVILTPFSVHLWTNYGKIDLCSFEVMKHNKYRFQNVVSKDGGKGEEKLSGISRSECRKVGLRVISSLAARITRWHCKNVKNTTFSSIRPGPFWLLFLVHLWMSWDKTLPKTTFFPVNLIVANILAKNKFAPPRKISITNGERIFGTLVKGAPLPIFRKKPLLAKIVFIFSDFPRPIFKSWELLPP